MRTLLRLLRLFRPYRGWIALGMLLSFFTLIANVGLMALSGWFIAAMAMAGASGAPINYFTPAAGIRGLAMVRTLGRYLERLVTHEATFRVLAGLRVWFYEHLEPLAPARLQQLRGGDLLSRIRADIDTLQNLYLRILVPLALAAAGVLAVSLLLWLQAPRLALANLGILLLAGIAVPLWVGRRARPSAERLVETRAELRTAVVDGVQGMAELAVYGAAEHHAESLDRLSRRLVEDQDHLSGLSGLSQAVLGLCASLSLWLVVLLAIPLVREGLLGPPTLAMVALLALAGFEAVLPLPAALQVLGETLAAGRRLFAIVDAETQIREPPGPSPRPRDLSVSFEAVGFSYGGDAPRALDGLTFHLAEGSKLAVLGATGAGKSTLANLLLRFWEPQQGRILLGGQDLRAYHGEDVRRLIGVVSQRTHLFNARIRDNLLLANPQAGQGAIEHACAVAQIHEFIETLPDGYDTWLGEGGVKLSGGQSRRIAIARALLKDAPILLLDEPTEGLDAPTQQVLMQDIYRLMQGRTVLLITHRPVGLEAMDQILVLDRGQVLERGTPGDLLAAGGRLAQMADFIGRGGA